MLSKNELDDAFRGISAELREGAQKALLEFADALMALDEKWGELGSEARVTWLNATQLSFLDSPWKLSRAISSVGSVVDFLDFLDGKNEADEDEAWKPIREANVAGEKARMALHAIVDRFRSAVSGAPRTVLIELPENVARRIAELDGDAAVDPWVLSEDGERVECIGALREVVAEVKHAPSGAMIADGRNVLADIARQARAAMHRSSSVASRIPSP